MKPPVSPAPGRVEPARAIRLGTCLLDLGAQRLLRGDTAIPLDPKAIGVLLHLVEAAPNFVSAEALLARTWQGTIVGDNALQQVIRRLRGAFGDAARSPRFIETLHRRGYRLLVTPGLTGSNPRTSAIANTSRRPTALTLAILPFADRSPGTIDPYLSEGLTLAIGSQLAKVAAIRLISRHAVTTTLAAVAEPVLAGAALGAECVLHGAVLAEHGRVRVTAQLHDSATCEPVWSATFDRAASDILALYCDIALAVADALGVSLTDQELVALESLGTRNPAALRLRHLAKRYGPTSTTDIRIAIELLESALGLDPDYAEARALLAWYYCWKVHNGARDALALARAHAERALRASEPSAWARYALATVLLHEGRQFAALIELRHAIDLNASHAFALQDLSFMLNHVGHPDEALEMAIRNLRIAPTSTLAHYHIAVPLLTLCEYERARLALERGCGKHADDLGRYRCEALLMQVDLLTDHPQAALERADALLNLARSRQIRELALAALETQLLLRGSDQVLAELEHWSKDAPASRSMIAATQHTVGIRLSFAIWQAGARGRASDIFIKVIDRHHKAFAKGQESVVALLDMAAAHAVQGDVDAAIDWLEQACDAGYLQHRPLRLDPMFADLRSDRRYEHLVARMNTATERMRAAVEDAGLLRELDALIERDMV